MQFGFSSGKCSIDAVFIVKKMQEKLHGRNKMLAYEFADLLKHLTGYNYI